MSQFKNFRDFAEAKEKGFADKKGGLPNQDIPKADKGPDLMKLKSDKPLGGRDYKGQMTTNPVKGTERNPLPYKGNIKNDNQKDVPTGSVRIHGEGSPKDGLAFKANKVLTPSNSVPDGKSPELKHQNVKGKVKMTSEQFLKETKDMSPAEFVSFFVEGSEEPLPKVTDLYGNEFTPDPNQTIQYLAALMVKNPRLLSRFTREMKRHEKGMNIMLDEHFQHPEFYTMLAEGMAAPEEGRKRCHRISRAMNDQYMDAIEKFVMEQQMNEEVQPKVDLPFEAGGPMGNEPENPSGMAAPKPPPKGGAFGGGGPGGEVPPPGVGGAFGGGGGPQMNGPPPGGAFGGGGGPQLDPAMAPGGPPGAPPGAGGPPSGMPGGMPPGAPPGGPGGLDMGMGQTPAAPMPKLKGETAHGNMIEEMGGFPHMFSAMSDYCINCKDKDKKK